MELVTPTAAARGLLRLETVTFGYEPGRPILHGVSLEARPGETIAIVGPTGAGKSTLVSLVPRFFDPWAGRVLVEQEGDRREMGGAELAAARAARPGPVVLVPTMGALHHGHRALLRAARAAAGPSGSVIVSIFVNPLQFRPGEDLDRYPRTLDDDLAMCAQEGVRAVFAPSGAEMYPGGPPQVTVDPGPAGQVFEGEFRPGFFGGVLTVVLKLFHLVRPDVAVFGEKDAQQLALVRRLVADTNLGVAIEAAAELALPSFPAEPFWALKREGATTAGALRQLGFAADAVEAVARLWRERMESHAWLACDRALPDARAVLRELSGQGVSVFLLTARRRSEGVWVSLAGAELVDLVQDVVVVDPSASARAKAEVLRERAPAGFVGDTESDGEAAERAGVAFVAVSTGQRSETYLRAHGHAVAPSLAEAVRRLRGRA